MQCSALRICMRCVNSERRVFCFVAVANKEKRATNEAHSCTILTVKINAQIYTLLYGIFYGNYYLFFILFCIHWFIVNTCRFWHASFKANMHTFIHWTPIFTRIRNICHFNDSSRTVLSDIFFSPRSLSRSLSFLLSSSSCSFVRTSSRIHSTIFPSMFTYYQLDAFVVIIIIITVFRFMCFFHILSQ